MTVNKLWTRYQKKRTDEHRNDLVMHYLPLARMHSNKVQRKVAKYLTADEIVGAASLGLIQAVESFDTSYKLKFESFAGYRIRGAIMDWLRELDTQSRTVRIFEKKKHKVVEFLGHNGIHEATQIAEKMGISFEQYTFLSSRVSHGKQIYLSSMIDPDQNAWDGEDKNAPDPTRTISRSFLQEFISKGMSRVDRMILALYYFESLTMLEISDIMGLSESRISQLRMQAMARVRGNLKGTVFEHNHSLLA